MNFHAEPARSRELAKLPERAQEDVQAGQKYLEQMKGFSGREGLINRLNSGHQQAYESMRDWLSKLADPAISSTARAVTNAAAYYERTDRAAAERLDSTYPETYVGDVRGHTVYAEIEPGVGAPVAVGAMLFCGYQVYRVVDGIKNLFSIIGKLDTRLSVVEAAQTKYGDIRVATVRGGTGNPVLRPEVHSRVGESGQPGEPAGQATLQTGR